MVSEYDFHAEFTRTDEFARLDLFMRAERIVTSQKTRSVGRCLHGHTSTWQHTPTHSPYSTRTSLAARRAFVHATVLPAPPLGLAPDAGTPLRARCRRRHGRSQQLGRRGAALAGDAVDGTLATDRRRLASRPVTERLRTREGRSSDARSRRDFGWADVQAWACTRCNHCRPSDRVRCVFGHGGRGLVAHA